MRRLRSGWPIIVSSAVIWVMLWGNLTVVQVVLGAVLGALIAAVFPLPPVPYQGRIHPVGLLILVATLLVDLVRGGIAVGLRAVGPTRPMRNAIIRVQLRSRSDLYLMVTAQLVSVVPGSSVVEVRRQEGVCYVHVMDIHSDADLPRAREQVLAAEARTLRAFGSAAEVALLDEPTRVRS